MFFFAAVSWMDSNPHDIFAVQCGIRCLGWDSQPGAGQFSSQSCWCHAALPSFHTTFGAHDMLQLTAGSGLLKWKLAHPSIEKPWKIFIRVFPQMGGPLNHSFSWDFPLETFHFGLPPWPWKHPFWGPNDEFQYWFSTWWPSPFKAFGQGLESDPVRMGQNFMASAILVVGRQGCLQNRSLALWALAEFTLHIQHTRTTDRTEKRTQQSNFQPTFKGH